MRAEGLKTLRASGKFDASVSDDELANTEEFEEIAIGMYRSRSMGGVVSCPGVPDMFVYEYCQSPTSLSGHITTCS